jgi:hypothetical protein
MNGEFKSGMQCAEFEAIVAEALDVSLHGTTLAAFEAHQASCAACSSVYQEAAAGMHWLKQLEDVEPPRNLVHNILAQTIGTVPEVSARAVATASDSWIDRMKAKIGAGFAPVMTPRFAMSFGMAFFSITLLANIAGFHVSDLKHVDVSLKGIQKTYYTTQARVVRYYENIRLVYEIESRVRDLRRAATPENEKQEESKPKNPKKGDATQREQNRKYQNYTRDVGQPVLAACPAFVEHSTPQARLNRRTV